MAIPRFISSNSADTSVLFENFGITFYYAQLLEDDLKLIIIAGEQLGRIQFDRKKDLNIKTYDYDLIKACMGSLKEVIKKNKGNNDSDEFYNILDESNLARRSLAHSFFIDHSINLLTEKGRRIINDDLSKKYLTIRKAQMYSKKLVEILFEELGVVNLDVPKEIARLKALMNAKHP